ncbi:glycoside hydrolase superfamily [Xylariomycetidae sp. FL2044]|nr:glycoside hydrolase superfamily [Xylariomycetidae sp. FL2044]
MRAVDLVFQAFLACMSVSTATGTQASDAEFLDWKTFKANGANLGSWLAKEKTHDPVLWERAGKLGDGIADTPDEWHLCEALGSHCAVVFEARYHDFLNTTTIDDLAAVGVNLLRITTTYAAWIDVPDSKLYRGLQQLYLLKIALYAIQKYDMHIVIGLHSLPGGTNNLDIGEAYGHDGWFYNQTNLDYSLDAVDAILQFINFSGYLESFTISPLNELSDNLAGFGTLDALSAKAANWTAQYMYAVIDRVEQVDKRIPIMLQDSFQGAAFWADFFDASANLVIDTHVYYFQVEGVSPQNVSAAVCKQGAALAAETTKSPTLVGEFATQVHDANSLDVATRKAIFDTQRYAWKEYVAGGAFWTAVSYANDTVDGEGTMRDYWSYVDLVKEGVITEEDESASYC